MTFCKRYPKTTWRNYFMSEGLAREGSRWEQKPVKSFPLASLEHLVGNKLGHFCSRSEPKFRCLLLFASS